jgi:dephospho-CoA kinase
MKPVIGLIGGIGGGKSSTAEAFRRRRAKVISGDRLGHEALIQPAIKEKLVQRWGRGILNEDGEIDRRRVATIVFADPTDRAALEALSFPWIERRISEEIAAAQADPAVSVIVLDAAVMLEAGWDRFCDRIVYVDAPPEVRLKRLALERGWTREEVEARERAQYSAALRRGRADATIDNGSMPDQLFEQVEQLIKRWGELKV